MPNTQPAIDSLPMVKIYREIISRTAQANVSMSSAITMGRQGKSIDMEGLAREGVIAFSDDGGSLDDADLLRQAFSRAKKCGTLVICHCEDKALVSRGVVNLGIISTCMGLRGISKESEHKRVARDLQLAKDADAAVHIAHVSCKESVELIAKAKKEGVAVTAETAPHYLAFTQEDVRGYDTNMKMNPPLRGEEDREALIAGLKNGTIDVIASDHAPHTVNEKDIEFEFAEFGVIGLETLLSVGVTYLIGYSGFTWKELIEKMSCNPARILRLEKGTLGAGKDADIAVLSPGEEWVVEKETLVSKSKNSSFLGRTLKGCVEYTICAGEIRYRRHA